MCGSRQAVKIQATLACSIMNLFSSLVAEKKKQEKRMRHLSNVYLRAAEAFHNHICYNAFQFAEKKGRF